MAAMRQGRVGRLATEQRCKHTSLGKDRRETRVVLPSPETVRFRRVWSGGWMHERIRSARRTCDEPSQREGQARAACRQAGSDGRSHLPTARISDGAAVTIALLMGEDFACAPQRCSDLCHG